MTERRQASRRTPIETELGDGRVFIAEPLPWHQASDLGNEIVRQNAESANQMVKMYVEDEGLPQLEFMLQQKLSNWGAVLTLAYPGNPPESFDKYDIDECAALALAALDVNHLEHIKHLVDPNFQPPTLTGGTNSSTSGVEDLLGRKTESIQPSFSEDSPETPPSPSLVQNS
jgi:hypothetical protein